MDRVRERVRQTWGVELRPHQVDAIQAALSGRDVMVTVATGGGKSLVYQALCLVRPPVLVVSPLIALIQDQVQAAKSAGIRVCNLGETVLSDDAQLAYATPERAVRHLSGYEWGAVAIDEAHCVVEWGSDFRPEYGQLSALRACPFPVVALTASATPSMVKCICRSLGMRAPVQVKGSFSRPNLTLQVKPKKFVTRSDTKFADVQSLVHPPCIVYVTKRAEADQLADALSMFASAPYHAGMSDSEREEVLQGFMEDRIRVICATIAFGMGINKPDIRSVIHYGPSRSLECYYQEVGRAGRDGNDSTCTLLVSKGDWPRLKYAGADAKALGMVEDYASERRCLHQYLVDHFGEESSECGKCSACVSGKSQVEEEMEDLLTVEEAQAAVQMVTRHPVFGVSSIASALRGDSSTHANLKANDHFGAWRGKSNATIHKGIKMLVRKQLIQERTRVLSNGKGKYTSLCPCSRKDT